MEIINIIWLGVIFIILFSVFYSASKDGKKKYDYELHYRSPSFKNPKFIRE